MKDATFSRTASCHFPFERLSVVTFGMLWISLDFLLDRRALAESDANPRCLGLCLHLLSCIFLPWSGLIQFFEETVSDVEKQHHLHWWGPPLHLGLTFPPLGQGVWLPAALSSQ